MLLVGEDAAIALKSAQLSNNFGFNWLPKQVYVGSRRVFPNTSGFTISPDPLLGSMCNIYWDSSFTDWRNFPVFSFDGSSNTSYFYRHAYIRSGSTYIGYIDRYQCGTAVGSYTTYQEYGKRMNLLNVKNNDYRPEQQIVRNIEIPQYINCKWLHHDDGVTNIELRGAVAYAIVIIHGDYDTFKSDFDANHGFVFLTSSTYSSTASIGILDPVPQSTEWGDELYHTGYRTTNRLLSKFIWEGETYSVVAMKGKLSSQPGLGSYYVLGMVSQPFIISGVSAQRLPNVPAPYRCMMIGAEYYGYQRTPS